MARNKVQWATYLEEDQLQDLKKISYETDIPIAALIRRAIDEFLNKVEGEGLWS